MTASFTNISKTAAAGVTNVSKGASGLTWDQADFTWDDPVADVLTWDNTAITSLTNVSKTAAAGVTNVTKN